MTMDMTESIAPKSDQMDYEDLIGGERIFTISEVRRGPSAEQPIEILLAEFPRPWRPAKTVRRLLVAAWGADGSQYVGQRVMLFGDPTVKWAGQPVGGIRVKAMSGIDKPLTVALTVARGKRAPFTVDPLPDTPHAAPTITPEQVASCTSIDELRGMWSAGGDQQEITRRVAELRAAVAPLPDPAPEDGAA
jgi:hypothetical protein